MIGNRAADARACKPSTVGDRSVPEWAEPHPPGSRHKQPGSGLCRRVIFLGAVVALLLVGGIGGYLAFGLSAPDAVYLTVLALTTERFSGGLRLSVGEEIFTATLAVLGVTGFVAVAEVAGTAVVEGRMALGRRRRMQRRIDSIGDH